MIRVAGVMTGTSVDGIDVAVVDLDPEAADWTATVRHMATCPFPDGLASRVRAVLPPATSTVADWCRLHTQVGAAIGAEVSRVAAALGTGIDLVVMHGQTLYHDVDRGHVAGTLQIGQPAIVAEQTGLPVVSDLRARDVAAGGQGAPLVACLDQLLLAGHDQVVAAVNLGGIANMTVLAPGRPTMSFDCGPANVLLDLAVQTNSGGLVGYDRDGHLAGTGTVDDTILGRLLADEFVALPPPKTTGRERYHQPFLDALVDGLPPVGLPDLLATLAVGVVSIISADLARLGVTRAWASGGGVHNTTLFKSLVAAAADRGIDLDTTAALGVPVDAKEAIAFAVLGLLTWAELPGNVPDATGASGPRILGSLTPGKAGWGDPGPVVSPRTLRMVLEGNLR